MALTVKRLGVCAAAAATTMAVVSAPAAQAKPPADPVTVVLSGLNNPYDVQFGTLGLMFVAENGGEQITAAIPAFGFSLPIVQHLPGIASATSPFGQLLFVTGAPEPEAGSPPPTPPPGSLDQASLYAANLFGPPHKIADLTAYELANNPDGQLQFDPVTHQPLDALSNPFRVLKRGFFDDTYIADGGANDVLAVDFFGNVRTLFRPPTVNTGACLNAPNNSPATPGCDSVPTGLAFGPNGLLYVSAFTAGVPGEGRVYVLDPRTGALQRTITGLDGPTGVAVGDDGSVYVTEVTYGAPKGGPGPDTDLSKVGRIVKIPANGARSTAAVPLPLGITFHDGALYSSAFSLAGPGAGKVVRVAPSAFTR